MWFTNITEVQTSKNKKNKKRKNKTLFRIQFREVLLGDFGGPHSSTQNE